MQSAISQTAPNDQIFTTPISWFNRSCGKWRSERRYIFKPDGKPVCYTTLMEVYPRELYNQFGIQWEGKTSGIMEVALFGDTMVRNRDYFGDGAHDSKMTMITDDMIRFTTSYDGTTFVETIELLSHDQYRLRQTFGTREDGSFSLAGQYVEFRI